MPAEQGIYGTARIGALTVALPVSALHETVACPADLDPMPFPAAGVAGSLTLRGDVLPVLDLRLHLGVTAAAPSERVVLVVADGDYRFGLLADAVCGVRRPDARDVQPVTTAEGAALVSHMFAGGDGPVAVLDAAAVRRLPGLPVIRSHTADGADERSAAGAARPSGTASEPRHTVVVFRYGAQVLGVDTALVQTILPARQAPATVVRSALLHGFVRHDGRQLPVVDPQALLGLAGQGRSAVVAHVVLRIGAGYIALPATELIALHRLAASEILPVPSFSLPRCDLVAGLVEQNGVGRFLLLDPAAVEADGDLGDLASASVLAEAPKTRETTRSSSEASFLTYAAGGDFATPLTQIAEILPVPAELTAAAADGPVLGVLRHRQAAIPLVCLATVLGRRPRPVNPCVIVVDVDGTLVGFKVDRLNRIDVADWAGKIGQAVAGPSGRVVQSRNAGRMISELNLRETGRSLTTAVAAGDCGSRLSA